MAHRGEAQAFIKSSFQKRLETEPFSLYQDNNDNILLLTQEGVHNALVATSYAMAKYPMIQRVYNLGICGALRSSLKTGEIYSIRTVYAENQFHSFTTSQKDKAALDLISSESRVLSDQERERLDVFAPLVDREAWAIGKVASQLKKEFIVYKLISDEVGEDKEICTRVKEKSSLWSQKLYELFLSIEDHDLPHSLSTQEDFFWHFSQSMKHEFKDLCHKAQLRGINKDSFLKESQIEKIQALEIHEKKKAKLLLKNMRDLLYPREKIIKERLEKLSFSPSQHLSFQFDSSLESSEVKFAGSFKNPREREDILKTFQNFPLKEWSDVFEGRDV